jgi:hypothetical protein
MTHRRPSLAAVVVLLLVRQAAPIGQAPGFGGTWQFDAVRSTIAADAGLFGLIGKGVPPTIHITQPANGSLVVESEINEGHARLYAPRGRTTTPVGQAGTITMSSKWSGRALVAEGTQESAAGTTTVTRQVKETYTLSPDGKTLSVDIAVTSGGTTASSALVFTRLASVGGCETWPTPCKRAP